MSQDTNISQLVINKLTKQQYDSIVTPNESELYLITDDVGITDTDIIAALGYTPQEELVSGTNIKTINNTSLLGNGNIEIQGGGSITIDQTYDPTSANAQSGVAIAGANFLTASSLNNYVTTNTDQNITGTKTFVGQKKIGFKQSASNNKLGFTLYDNNNVEKGYLEFNPTNTIDGAPLMTLGNYASAADGITHVGFRKYSSISGASGAYNLLTPLISDAKTPFSLTTTYTNFYLPLGFTDGTNTVLTSKSGLVDLSSILPSSVTVDQTYSPNSANAQSGVAIQGELEENYAHLYGDVEFNSVNTQMIMLGNELTYITGETDSEGAEANNIIINGNNISLGANNSIDLIANTITTPSGLIMTEQTSLSGGGEYNFSDVNFVFTDQNGNRVCDIGSLGTTFYTYDTNNQYTSDLDLSANGLSLGIGNKHAVISLADSGNLVVNNNELATQTWVNNQNYQTTNNLVTSISSSSTDSQYPSAKCVYDLIGNIETLLQAV
jgi:predicted transcriptional regulator